MDQGRQLRKALGRIHGRAVAGVGLAADSTLGDYASVVAQLIEIFARVAERDELSLYNDLVTANRDVVRVRVGESDDGSLSMNAGVDLI